MEETFDGAILSERDYVNAKAPLIEAWNKTPFLETDLAPKLKSDYEKAVMAQIFENTKAVGGYGALSATEALKASFMKVNQSGLLEATTPTKTTAWAGATNLPMVLGYVRKLMPKIMGLELVQTQPLALPTGRVFYLNRKHHEDTAHSYGIIEARAGWSYRSWVDDPGEAETLAKSVTIVLTSANVEVASHKLKAETSIEFEQDLRAYHNMDGRALLAEAATDEMAMELSERILWRLLNERDTLVIYGTNPDSTAYSASEWALRYLEAWNRADNIAWNKRRTRTNWAVVGNEGQIQLSLLPQTIGIPEGQRPVGDAMLQRLGTLNNRWTVYTAPLPWGENDALLGYVGDTWSDACMFYLPYVPLMVAGMHFDPDKMTWIISWLSRDTMYVPSDGGKGLAVVQVSSSVSGISYPALSEYV